MIICVLYTQIRKILDFFSFIKFLPILWAVRSGWVL